MNTPNDNSSLALLIMGIALLLCFAASAWLEVMAV